MQLKLDLLKKTYSVDGDCPEDASSIGKMDSFTIDFVREKKGLRPISLMGIPKGEKKYTIEIDDQRSLTRAVKFIEENKLPLTSLQKMYSVKGLGVGYEPLVDYTTSLTIDYVTSEKGLVPVLIEGVTKNIEEEEFKITDSNRFYEILNFIRENTSAK